MIRQEDIDTLAKVAHSGEIRMQMACPCNNEEVLTVTFNISEFDTPAVVECRVAEALTMAARAFRGHMK